MPHIADGHKHHSNHQVVEKDYFQVKINDADDNGDGQHVYAASQRAVTCQTKATTDLGGFVLVLETFSKSSSERVPSECRHCRLTSDIFTKEFFTSRQPRYIQYGGC